MSRTCTDCGEPHDESNFYRDDHGCLQKRCKRCQREVVRAARSKYGNPMEHFSPVAQRFLAIRFTGEQR